MYRKTLLLVCWTMVVITIPFSAMALVATMEQITPNPTTYVLGVDFYPFLYTAIGDVTGMLENVPGDGATGDFAGFTKDHIALIERGTLTFQAKVQNASLAGALGAIIYNNVPGDVILGTLGSLSEIPAIFISRDLGLQLLQVMQSEDVTIHFATYTSEPPPINQVPEPTTMLLFGAGLAGLGIMRKRFKI